MSAGSLIAAIDHVAFGAIDIESARQGFERLGFSVTARGRCTWGTAAASFAAASHCVAKSEDLGEV